MRNVKKMMRNIDLPFAITLAIMLAVNLIVLTSASGNIVSGHPFYYVKKQAFWIVAGFIAMAVVAMFDYKYFPKIFKALYGIITVLLIGVLFMPAQKGAHRWYDLGFFDLQPSELAKLVMIVAFACFIVLRYEDINRLRNLLLSVIFMAFPALLILIEPDLGTAMVFIAIFFVMMWVGGVSPKIIGIALLIIVVLVVGIFIYLYFITGGFQYVPDEAPRFLPMEPYQINRLIIFINPYMDPLGSGYHMIQSEVAIGSGGFLGKGFGQGSQVQGNFLPEHHTDFIFSVVGEEFGFLGSMGLILLYSIFLYRGIRIAYNAKDLLGTLIVSGVVAMFAFQIFINVGMTIGIMPITGLPLPFLSYGGSGMLVNMMAIGLILSVNMRSQEAIF